MKVVNWDDFNNCVASVTHACANQQFSGVYGFPRGGLCLAVALSHSLGIPLLNKPQPDSLVVDDVYETGFTLSRVRDLPGITAFVWFSKVEPKWWSAVEITDPQQWLVFPWEKVHFAELDEQAYRLSARKK